MRGGPASTSGGGGGGPSTPLPPPPTPSADELANILPLLRRPELLASLKFVGKAVPGHTVKPGLIREVLSVLRGSEGNAKRDALGEKRRWFASFISSIGGDGVGDFVPRSLRNPLTHSPLSPP